MDEVVEKLVALGVPGLVLLIAVSASGFAGGAAIVVALATLGGPLGMLGGIAVLGILGLVTQSLAKFGMEAIAEQVVKGLVREGTPPDNIIREVQNYPITRGMKRRVEELVAKYRTDSASGAA